MKAKSLPDRFLLAKLQIESLMTKTTLRAIRTLLQALPAELDAMYDQVFQRIRGQDSESCRLALKTLGWIHSALRPLTIAELSHATAVELGDIKFDAEGIPEFSMLESVCAGLITVQRNDIVTLVHYTASEYLRHHTEILAIDRHQQVAQTCLAYLSMSDFSGDPSGQDGSFVNRLGQYPLLSYSSCHWGAHARLASEEQLVPLALSFLVTENNRVASIQAMQAKETPYKGWSQEYTKSMTPLELASSFGLLKTSSALIDNGADVEAKDSKGQGALHRAAVHGFSHVVKLLLDNNASINSSDGERRRTSLHWASEAGSLNTVKTLLDHGADYDATDKRKQTALIIAASSGHESIVQQLLCAGAAIDTQDAYKATALWRAAECGHFHVVCLLLHAGARTDICNEYDQTPLHRAADIGHLQIVERLLEHGADPSPKDYYGWTPWYRAADNGHDEVAKFIVKFTESTEITRSTTIESTPCETAPQYTTTGALIFS